MKKVLFAVINDFATDQRVQRMANTLHEENYKVKVLGRKLKQSPHLSFPYPVIRYLFLINKGPFFYTCFNFRLFFILLFSSFDIVIANDLDTLPACWLASKCRGKKLLFDSHELFPEVPEIQQKPTVKKVWLIIERLFVSRVKFGYTVCQSISDYYFNKYKVKLEVIRNVPDSKNYTQNMPFNHSLALLEKVIIYQGALNMGRGIEKLMGAMEYLSNCSLIIVGTGDLDKQLQNLAQQSSKKEHIHFLGRINPKNLPSLTRLGHLGVSLEENMGLNYYFALPNKLFDYIHSEIPVLVSDFPEMRNIVFKYNIGKCSLAQDSHQLAIEIQDFFQSPNYNLYKNNTKLAAQELNWSIEKQILINLMKKIS